MKSIFIGSSHFQGFGLEYELCPKYQSQSWLEENGIWGPSTGPTDDEEHKVCKENRWSYLLSQRLNLEEINVGDYKEYGSGNSLKFLDIIIDSKKDLSDVKYIFLEYNYLPEDGVVKTKDKLIKIQERIFKNVPNEELELKDNIEDYQIKLNIAKKLYPHIKFWLINSFGFGPKIFRESFKGDILEYYGNDGKNYDSVLRGSHHNKQLVSETAFGFIQENPTWEFTTDPIHLNLEANKHLSKIYYEQITSGKPIVSFESGKTFI